MVRQLTSWQIKEIIEKMKRFSYLIVSVLAVAGMIVQPPVIAQEMIPATGDTPVDRLQASCDTILGVLRRLHTSDSLLRVNIGQTYNGISVRLMARLNSRLALNRIDSTRFVEIAGQFDQQREDFSRFYSEYEAALSSLTKVDCKSRPTEFYAGLISARDARSRLATTVQSMNDSVSDYQVEVERLKRDILEEAEREGDN